MTHAAGMSVSHAFRGVCRPGRWKNTRQCCRMGDEMDEKLNNTDTDTWYRCTVCGREGKVGRCCGDETRIPLNEKARKEQAAQRHENGTSYRDRVHSASIAILPLLMERWNEPGYSDVAACYESVRLAIIQIDAIDKVIAERESKHED